MTDWDSPLSGSVSMPSPFGAPLPVGRLAPSPTGALHLGNLRTFLCAWLSIRSSGGKLWMRIEDIDSPRIKAGSMESMLEDLRWFGLDWDGEPLVQSSRIGEHQKALKLLCEKELVFPCTCSRTDVERAASAPHEGQMEQDGPIYPGTCSNKTAKDAQSLDGPFAWRFRFDPGREKIRDKVLGELDLRVGGDFVVWKSPRGAQSASPAYQLSVVVDDHFQGITEVVRGDDLVHSTPKQIRIAQALGYQSPSWAHVPLVVGEDGLRLAKRHGDTRVASLRRANVPPDVLCGYLAWSLGWNENRTPLFPKDLLGIWSWESLKKNPWVLRKETLREMGYDSAAGNGSPRH